MKKTRKVKKMDRKSNFEEKKEINRISFVDLTDIYIPLNTASLAALKTAPYFFFSELRQAI